MKMLLTDSLMRSTQLLRMIGGKGQFTVYCQCLHILVPGPGNSGDRGKKYIGFRNMLNRNMTIHVSALADHVLYTRG